MADYLTAFQFNGERFLTVALILILVYLLLNIADGFLKRSTFFGRWHKRIKISVHNLFLIYEPISLLLIAVSFLLINPIFFGALGLILMVTGIDHLRNYISGRLVQLDKGIELGNQIRTGNFQGIISEISRFGIRLKTAKGVQFIMYPQLLATGYSLSAGEDLGGFYRLIIASPEETDSINSIKLKAQMVTTPFLDWSHDTEFAINYDHLNQIEAKVLVREDHHLHDLIALIKEWGYNCRVSKK